MKYILLILAVCFWNVVVSQTTQTPDQIRQQMAKIRQTTNWDDPGAAQKANDQIKKLASQLNGGKQTFSVPNSDARKQDTTSTTFEIKSAITQTNIVAIADRFYKRSYKALNAVSKSQFDQDYKKASEEKFNLKAVHMLTSVGGVLIASTNNSDLACVYLASAVKTMPADTLSINNFGGYLRLIDSTQISLPVLLYANKLFNQSPVILTQIGCSYFELKDYKQAEFYLKEALKCNPDFGQAHTTLCDLYLIQNRLQDAILELFAGVKNIGCSYRQASNSFAYMQQQAENSDTKEDFWDETRKQINPDDALAPLMPESNRLKMPSFGNCTKVSDWMEGGGWNAAVQGYTGFHAQNMKFAGEFLQVHKEAPNLPPNTVLRDYPNERFALDCITEYFMHESHKEAKKFDESIDKIMNHVYQDRSIYIDKHAQYGKEYASCIEGCGDEYCLKECQRKYCLNECPAANEFNQKLQLSYDDYRTAFTKTVDNQTKMLDDLYAFSDQWFSKIQSPYWSKIYAYEIQRVAFLIIGNAYMAYPRPFGSLAHNECGPDCSLYVNQYPIPPESLEDKEPKGNECNIPKGSKKEIGIGPLSVSWDCEGFELSFSEGIAGSIKRNNKRGTTTFFLGGGVEHSNGVAKAGGRFGGQIEFGDNWSVDGGLKSSVSGTSLAQSTDEGVKGGEIEFNVMILGGVSAEATKIVSPFH
jgi:tetratricopeptide (TPR) repeat protein